ncbi:hypothetical protein BKA65DRAFT_514952 [Rhexocercosporidium sp. MPI-PUGE-AT-0058]|nr:hypothetical protein BKA65DRAFT_514952 [Rhexocercosporidium sp. MPI-PUGE-AT-0058]
MAPRGTARSSAARNQASSPPKASRQSQSPVGRRTRSSRSRSVDPQAIDSTRNKQRAGRRGDREASVSSVGSDTSASSTVSRTRKRAQKPAINQELSIVAEDDEDGEEAQGFDPSEDEDEDIAIEIVNTQNQGSRSPAMSQMSGTTAMTSYSAQEIAKLDPMMAEILRELLESASKILDQLAPKGAIDTEDQVEAIMTDLKIPGSRRGKHLRLHERMFGVAKDYYGSDIYIRPSFVLRKLLGTDSPEEGDFRPDPVLHAANLATLVTEFLVLQRGEAKTKSTLQGVCNIFPESFMGKLDEVAEAGQSESVDAVFDLALDFYTQSAMVCLAVRDEEGDEFTPAQVLASVFYDQYDESDPYAPFAEMTDGGVLKNILRSGQPYSEAQVEMIQERLALINGTFRSSEEARDASDLVDFDQLNEMFPWLTFITHIVQWSRSRFTEITETISKQGGVDEITQSLIELIKSNDSQVEIRYDPPPAVTRKRELLPAADITQSNERLIGNAQALHRIKQRMLSKSLSAQEPASSVASSSRLQPRSKQASSAPRPVPVQRDAGPAQEVDDNFQPMVDDGDDSPEERPRPTAEYTAAWNENSKEKNKENHKPAAKPVVKPRLIDRQPNAQKVVWDESQDSIAGSSPTKRTRAESEHSDESEDQGFQMDERRINPNRRADAPPGPRLSPVDKSSPPRKKQRVSQRGISPRVESSRASAQRRSESADSERARSKSVDDSEIDSEDGTPPPTAAEISAAARYATARAKGVQAPRGRTPWSEGDSNLLKRRIEKYGCAWSTIFQLGKWEVPRDQVALKDRARNMKVNMLKSGMPLPLNWEHVPLGKKEIALVRAKFPDYEE